MYRSIKLLNTTEEVEVIKKLSTQQYDNNIMMNITK